MELNGYSWPVPGRVYTNSASSGLVQDTRELRGYGQDRSHACLRRSLQGDDPYFERGQSHMGLVDDHASATWVALSSYPDNLSRLR
jgi:hypothetical protein